LDSSQRAYAIYYDGKHVGNCGLKNFDTDNSYCELWIYIGEITMRGRGIAKYAVQKLKTLAKDEFKFNSIYLHVDKKNHVAKCLYTANGFEEVVERLMPPWQSLENDVLKMVCNLCDAQ
jgi:RimJ/RimL family protein N-acetyltransferase